MSSNRETLPPPTNPSGPPPPPRPPSPNLGSGSPPPLPTTQGSGPPPPIHGSGPPPAAGVVANWFDEEMLEIEFEQQRFWKKRKEQEDKAYEELGSSDQSWVHGDGETTTNPPVLFPIKLDMSQYTDMEIPGEYDERYFWQAYQHMNVNALDGTRESKVVHEPTLHKELKVKWEGEDHQVQNFLNYMHKLKLEDTKFEQVDPDGKKWFPRLQRGKDKNGTNYLCWYEKGSRDQYLHPPKIMTPSNFF